MIKTSLIIVWTVLASVVFGLLTVLVSPFDRWWNGTQFTARTWARTILAVARIPVTVKGEDRLKTGTSYIFMSNHQSNFDIPVLLGHLKVPFRWLAKAELFRIPIFGHGMRAAGYISIDRSNRRLAIESLRTAAQTIRDGVSVVIFPEGTRSLDGRIGPYKKGGFVLAVEAGVPVVPVVIHGTWNIMPRSTFRIVPGPVTIEILEPIPTTDYTRKTKDELMEKVRAAMDNAFQAGGGSPPC